MTREKIEEILKKIMYPGMNKDIVMLGIVKKIDISDKSIAISLDLRSDDTTIFKQVEESLSLRRRQHHRHINSR